MNELEVQRLYQFAIDERPRNGCVDEQELLALVQQSGSEKSRLAVLDHVMTCGACRREFELLRAINLSGPTPSTHRREAPLLKRTQVWLPLAATILIGFAATLYLGTSRSAPTVTRGANDSLTAIEPIGEVATGPVTFIWHSVEGAIAFDLEVTRQDGSIVSSATTRDTALVVDAAWLERPGIYSWWVTARFLDGTSRRSDVEELVVTR